MVRSGSLQFVLETSPQYRARPQTLSWPCPIEANPNPVGGTLEERRVVSSFKLLLKGSLEVQFSSIKQKWKRGPAPMAACWRRRDRRSRRQRGINFEKHMLDANGKWIILWLCFSQRRAALLPLNRDFFLNIFQEFMFKLLIFRQWYTHLILSYRLQQNKFQPPFWNITEFLWKCTGAVSNMEAGVFPSSHLRAEKLTSYLFTNGQLQVLDIN